MTHYLLGSRGRLGKALTAELSEKGLVELDREIYEGWAKPHRASSVSRFFDQIPAGESTVIVASGLLDPKLPLDDLFAVNYHLPKNIIDGVAGRKIHVLTFGSVMEGLLQQKNTYLESKSRIARVVEKQAADGCLVTHVRLHTLFGMGQPSPFMFLGQILHAIKFNEIFRMTSGQQLREYHHLEDDARAIRCLLESGYKGIFSLDHGYPLSLRVIAESIFEAMDRTQLLRVGEILDPIEEVYDNKKTQPLILEKIIFRDSLPAIIQYLRDCLRCY